MAQETQLHISIKNKMIKKLSSFYNAFILSFDPIKIITDSLYQMKPEVEVVNLVESLKNKKINNILFNECLSLAIIKRQSQVCLKLLETFPSMDINLGYRSEHFTQDAPLNLATVCINHADELIITLMDKTKNINQEAKSHSSQAEHYPNALFSYLLQARYRNKSNINIEVIQKFIDAGSHLDVTKEILIKNGTYDTLNLLDLAISSHNAKVVDLFLNTPLATFENIEHAKIIYEHNGLSSFSPEKDSKEIFINLNQKMIQIEKEKLENNIVQPTISLPKKVKI